MTVASIPMVSALARSMPISLATAPRKILPPPMTSAKLAAQFFDFFDLLGKGLDGCAVDAKIQRPGEDFAGDFEDDALVLRGAPLFMTG